MEDGDGASPLYYGASNGKEAVLGVLLARGADPNFQRKTLPRSPLHAAVGWKHHVCIKQLLDAGANPNGLDAQGDSPLIYACRGNGDEKLVSLLLENGADAFGGSRDVDPTQKTRESPIAVAKALGNKKLVELLEKHVT